MNIETMEHIEYNKSAPKWRLVIPGLNLLGTHPKNSYCEAKGEYVVSRQEGLGLFNIAREIFRAKCPLCDSKLENVTDLYFSSCQFEVEGLKSDGNWVTIES